MGQLCSRTLSEDAPEDEGGSCDASQPSEGGAGFGRLSAQNLAALAVPLPALPAPFSIHGRAWMLVGPADRDELQLIANKLSVPEWARTLAQVRFGLQATCVVKQSTAAKASHWACRTTATALLLIRRAPARCTPSRQPT